MGLLGFSKQMEPPPVWRISIFLELTPWIFNRFYHHGRPKISGNCKIFFFIDSFGNPRVFTSNFGMSHWNFNDFYSIPSGNFCIDILNRGPLIFAHSYK